MSNPRRLYVVDPQVRPSYDTEWAQWMHGAGLSPRTIEERVQLLDRFQRSTGVNAAEAQWQILAQFLGNLPSAGTRYTYFTHLRSWYRWLVQMDYRVDDPTMKLRAPRAPKRKPRPVTVGQLDDILTTRKHRRTEVMALLGAYEGLRVDEIARFRGEQIQGDRLIVIGKGGRQDELPVHELIAEVAEQMPRRGLWFPSHVHPGHPVLGNSVSTILTNLMRRAGVHEPYTAHSLRHFFGTYLLRTGCNLVVVQQLMRHASIATTTVYTEVEDSARRAAVNALPVPRSLRRRRWAA